MVRNNITNHQRPRRLNHVAPELLADARRADCSLELLEDLLKMPPQNFVVAWREHYGELVSAFENLLKSSTLVDCTLAAEGQFLKAHKVVLSACSPYFKLLFSEVGENHPIVILKDIAFEDLKIAVDFMYKGEVQIHEDRLSAILEITRTLQIKGLGKVQSSWESSRKVPAASVINGNTNINSRDCSSKLTATNVHVQNAEDSTLVSIGNSQISDDKFSFQPSGRESSSPAITIASSSSIVSSSCPLVSEVQSEPRSNENSGCSLPAFLGFSSIDNLASGTQPVMRALAYEGLEADSVNKCEEVFEEDTTLVDPEHWVEEKSENVIIEHATSQEYGDFSPSCVVTENLSSNNMVATETEDHPMVEGAANTNEDYQAPVTRYKQFHIPVEAISFPDTAETAGNTTWETEMRPVNKLDLEPPEETFRNRQSADMKTLVQPQMDVKRFKCPECKYASNIHGDLIKHIRIHTDEGPYKCGECEYASTRKALLILHMRVHSGKRPYKCSYCAFSSSAKSNLNAHMRVHTGKRPFICKYCAYAASTSSKLNVHLRIHTREKPYKCPECNLCFLRNGRLKKHRNKTHGVQGTRDTTVLNLL